MTAPSTPALPQMTLRQWYAGQALAGVMSNADSWQKIADHAKNAGLPEREMAAVFCFVQADAMIAAEKADG